jgi:hypothetical protein
MGNYDTVLTYNANWFTTSTSTVSNVIYTSPTYYPAYGGHDAPRAVEAAPRPETDMAWLKRRVQEVSWVPA